MATIACCFEVSSESVYHCVRVARLQSEVGVTDILAKVLRILKPDRETNILLHCQALHFIVPNHRGLILEAAR